MGTARLRFVDSFVDTPPSVANALRPVTHLPCHHAALNSATVATFSARAYVLPA